MENRKSTHKAGDGVAGPSPHKAGDGVAGPGIGEPTPAPPTRTATSQRPLLSGEITQRYWPPAPGDSESLIYRPALLGLGACTTSKRRLHSTCGETSPRCSQSRATCPTHLGSEPQ